MTPVCCSSSKCYVSQVLNPELASALSRWDMLLGRVPQVSSLDDPMVQAVKVLPVSP